MTSKTWPVSLDLTQPNSSKLKFVLEIKSMSFVQKLISIGRRKIQIFHCSWIYITWTTGRILTIDRMTISLYRFSVSPVFFNFWEIPWISIRIFLSKSVIREFKTCSTSINSKRLLRCSVPDYPKKWTNLIQDINPLPGGIGTE